MSSLMQTRTYVFCGTELSEDLRWILQVYSSVIGISLKLIYLPVTSHHSSSLTIIVIPEYLYYSVAKCLTYWFYSFLLLYGSFVYLQYACVLLSVSEIEGNRETEQCLVWCELVYICTNPHLFCFSITSLNWNRQVDQELHQPTSGQAQTRQIHSHKIRIRCYFMT